MPPQARESLLQASGKEPRIVQSLRLSLPPQLRICISNSLPRSQMWKGYEPALVKYLNLILVEWEGRGYKNELLKPYDPGRGLDSRDSVSALGFLGPCPPIHTQTLYCPTFGRSRGAPPI